MTEDIDPSILRSLENVVVCNHNDHLAIQRIRELHFEKKLDRLNTTVCNHCWLGISFPCPTLRALEEIK